jgi:hypothetical protein
MNGVCVVLVCECIQATWLSWALRPHARCVRAVAAPCLRAALPPVAVRCFHTSRPAATAAASAATDAVQAALNNGHPANNVPPLVKARVGANLHRTPGHPLCLIKDAIHNYFATPKASGGHGPPAFRLFDDISPVVTTRQNFDELLTPADHVSRRPSDTFYVSDTQLLRCHTSAHQTQVDCGPARVPAVIARRQMCRAMVLLWLTRALPPPRGFRWRLSVVWVPP